MLLLLVAASLLWAAQAAATAHDGVLVFASDRDGEFDLWTVSASGGEPVQLADQTGDDQSPRWSPDGTQIAYIKNPNTTSGRLWLIDADGSDAHTVVSIQARFPPAWSPDGSLIAFTAHSGDGDFDLHVVTPNGGGLTKLADTTANETYVTWLGSMIAVARGNSIVVVDPATGADVSTFELESSPIGLTTSPDGDTIAFSQQMPTGIRIAVIDVVSGVVLGVTDGTERDIVGAWSPDGSRIVFGRGSSGADLYVVGVDGSGLTQLTSSASTDIQPDWLGSTAPQSIALMVGERVGVTDLIQLDPGVVGPPISIDIGEIIGVFDEVDVHPPITIFVSEAVTAFDTPTIPLPITIFVSEAVTAFDTPTIPLPITIFVSEAVTAFDDPRIPLAVAIVVAEDISVVDRVTVSEPVTLTLVEGIGVMDVVALSVATQVDLPETDLVPGDEVEFSGHGFAPGSAIEVGIESTFCLLTTTTADADGAFSVVVTIPGPEQCPGLEAGSHTLVALGVDPNGVSHRVQAPLAVRAPVDVLLSPTNPMSVLVDTPVMLRAIFTDVSGGLTDDEFDPDAAYIRLEPVGPGSPIEPAWCHPTALEGEYLVDCAFTGPLVNTYTVLAAVDSGHFYGSDEGVLTVYDPSLGFTTGGGWFEWPENGERTGFGFTIKHNKKGTNVLGSFVLVRASDEGARFRVKSNALEGLALGSEPGHSWATFTGKATYLSPETPEPEGNYTFVVYVEDGRPDQDRFWLEVRDRDGNVVIAISLAKPPSENAVIVSGGDIQVPHFQGRGPR